MLYPVGPPKRHQNAHASLKGKSHPWFSQRILGTAPRYRHGLPRPRRQGAYAWGSDSTSETSTSIWRRGLQRQHVKAAARNSQKRT